MNDCIPCFNGPWFVPPCDCLVTENECAKCHRECDKCIGCSGCLTNDCDVYEEYCGECGHCLPCVTDPKAEICESDECGECEPCLYGLGCFEQSKHLPRLLRKNREEL